jgi:hypothetical protein
MRSLLEHGCIPFYTPTNASLGTEVLLHSGRFHIVVRKNLPEASG